MPVITTGPGTIYVGTTTSSTTGTTWQSWNQNWTAVGTASTTTTWVNWNTVYTGQAGIATYAQAPETEEQRAEREACSREWRERADREARERQAARDRAEELLILMLSEEQQQSRRENGWFAVRGSTSGKVYRIRAGQVSNVDEMDGNEVAARHCAHPPQVPDADAHLAQMLLLATDEDQFLRVANTRRLRPEPRLQAVPDAPAGAPVAAAA